MNIIHNNNILEDINNIIIHKHNNLDINDFISTIINNNNNIKWFEYYIELYINRSKLDINNLLLNIKNNMEKIINPLCTRDSSLDKAIPSTNNNIDHFIIIHNNIININEILNIYNYDYNIVYNIPIYTTNTFSDNFKIIKIYLYMIYIMLIKDNKEIIKRWMIGLIKKQTNYIKYWTIL